MSAGKEVLLKVDHLCQYFGANKAVDDVSFEVYRGEVFGLVGESGCGKTTTGRSIIKLHPITAGSIFFEGHRISAGIDGYRREIRANKKEISKLRKEKSLDSQLRIGRCRTNIHLLRRKIAAARQDNANIGMVTQIQMIFQDPMASLDPRMTVKEIIAEGLIIAGVRDKVLIESKVLEILDLVGLRPEYAARYPHEFSGGQRQRIGIARAVVMKPEMIIADEPISALDVSIQAQVINLLNDLRDQLGLTILFIAHDLSVVKFFSDRIGVMYFGKMVELASSDELFAHPLHPYTRSLLSAIPLPDPITERKRKRIMYDPLAEHDYSVDKPTLREIVPGHWVQCNDAEEVRYKKELGI